MKNMRKNKNAYSRQQLNARNILEENIVVRYSLRSNYKILIAIAQHSLPIFSTL